MGVTPILFGTPVVSAVSPVGGGGVVACLGDRDAAWRAGRRDTRSVNGGGRGAGSGAVQ